MGPSPRASKPRSYHERTGAKGRELVHYCCSGQTDEQELEYGGEQTIGLETVDGGE